MNYRPVLEKVKNNKLSCQEAYNVLYAKKVKAKAAHFIKMRMRVKESKMATFMCGALFLVPTPVFIARMLFRIFRKKIPLGEKDYRLIIQTLSEAGGSEINVHSADADIRIRLF
jgi:hypothetical protein